MLDKNLVKVEKALADRIRQLHRCSEMREDSQVYQYKPISQLLNNDSKDGPNERKKPSASHKIWCVIVDDNNDE
ncbi:hypothetical protein PGTUg99_006060 [Puccinia graminis f. sp. tritici]|uniref:Uncharacterized protein n=1 Tax=Puccinia graminis f. sp. tritici TaxID=56615 RepID=A0A5B0QZB8_PUCGR|nr:hypothetical protein PGTUg99_006060 [Puccinia graminis f. sp. tritici]